MKETVGSLRAYFILVALLGGYQDAQYWTGPRTPLALIFGVVGALLSLGWLYVGIRLPALLADAPGQIYALLIASALQSLAALAVLLSGGVYETSAVVLLAIGLVIVGYLYVNVRRLSAEERAKRAAAA